MARSPNNTAADDAAVPALVIAAEVPSEPAASGEVGDVSFASEACRSRLDEMANLVAVMTPADRAAIKAALAAFAKTL